MGDETNAAVELAKLRRTIRRIVAGTVTIGVAGVLYWFGAVVPEREQRELERGYFCAMSPYSPECR